LGYTFSIGGKKKLTGEKIGRSRVVNMPRTFIATVLSAESGKNTMPIMAIHGGKTQRIGKQYDNTY